MEPGKIPHEVRHGELAQLGILPYQPYYGTHDATSLYVIVLSYLYQWLGDESSPPALPRRTPRPRCAGSTATAIATATGSRSTRRARRTATTTRAGRTPATRSSHADGTLAPLPIATCELQGYVYDAKLRMGDIYEILGRPTDARRLRREARSCTSGSTSSSGGRRRGRTTSASTAPSSRSGRSPRTPATCSSRGSCRRSAPARVVKRLLADDMWSGWGVRTLSSDHPAYNPFSYHTGSVWPHDNAMIAGGFRRYGFDAEAAKVAKGIVRRRRAPGRATACRSCSRGCHGARRASRSSTSARTCRRPGRRARSCG